MLRRQFLSLLSIIETLHKAERSAYIAKVELNVTNEVLSRN